MAESRRRGSSVTRFLQEVGNPAAKAQRRADEINKEGGPRHFVIESTDKLKTFVIRVERAGLKVVERPDGNDKHSIDKVHSLLDASTLYAYMSMPNFAFNNLSEEFGFTYRMAATAAAPATDDGKKKKKKKEKKEEAAPAAGAYEDKNFLWKTPQVLDIKKEILKQIEELKKGSASPRDEKESTDKTEEKASEEKSEEKEEPKKKARSKSKGGADKDAEVKKEEHKEEEAKKEEPKEEKKDEESKEAPKKKPRSKSKGGAEKDAEVKKEEPKEEKKEEPKEEAKDEAPAAEAPKKKPRSKSKGKEDKSDVKSD